MRGRKVIEKILRDSPFVKVQIENIKIDIDYFNYKLDLPSVVVLDEEKSYYKCQVEGCISQLKEKEDYLRRIDKVLDALSVKEREVVELRYFKCLSIRECSELLGITETSILRRLNKVLLKISERYGNEIY